jgi:hypothetical protein
MIDADYIVDISFTVVTLVMIDADYIVDISNYQIGKCEHHGPWNCVLLMPINNQSIKDITDLGDLQFMVWRINIQYRKLMRETKLERHELKVLIILLHLSRRVLPFAFKVYNVFDFRFVK